MQGTLKTLNAKGRFGFIRCNNIDYFFHRDDFDGHWVDLVEDHEKHIEIKLEFEPTTTDKGPRAAEVHLA